MQGALVNKLGSLSQNLFSRRQNYAPVASPNVRCTQLQEIKEDDVNVVHIRRSAIPTAELQAMIARSGQQGFRAQAKVPVQTPKRAVESLLWGLVPADQQAEFQLVLDWLNEDISELCQEFAEVCPPEDGLLNVKLQHVLNTPCSKFHSDHVLLRLLVTYFGPGTLYMPDSCVSRSFEADGHPVVGVEESDAEAHAEQTDFGDLLLLKGHSWPGNMGRGAVHKSPTLDDNCDCAADHGEEGGIQNTRLVLTIDTATDW